MTKWNFLKDYAKNKQEKNSDITITEIAKLAIEEFNLDHTIEQIRKAISRELNSVEQIVAEVVDTPKPRAPRNLIMFESAGDFKPTHFKDPGTYLVLGCVHVPGENKAMIDGIAQLIKDKPDLKGLMLIGDFLDMNSLSGHDIGKFTALPGLTLGKEYEAGNVCLNKITEHLNSKAHRVFIYGNHEDRYNRYMGDMQKAKATIASPEQGLYLQERGFHVYTKWQQDKITLGNHLDLIHGEYYNVHSAKKHIDVYRGSVMYVHTHRVQSYIEGSVGGFNIGWGGDVNSPLFNYMPRGTKSQWQNGFAMVTIDKEGLYYVEQVICHSNKFYYGGKQYGQDN